ncbi:hypothetical protein ABEB36_009239 [Hypothenemus hampei]|uniref:THAP-type domain-containing protein n=1 Tax=Hypothenemus hampei TaxID=57062 RepID=A0ABD1EPM0_HYPHA
MSTRRCILCKKKQCDTANSYYSFPKDVILQSKWKRICNLEDNIVVNNLKICSDHFDTDDFVENSIIGKRGILRLKLGAIPKGSNCIRTKGLLFTSMKPCKNLKHVYTKYISKSNCLTGPWSIANLESSIIEENCNIHRKKEETNTAIDKTIDTICVEENCTTLETISNVVTVNEGSKTSFRAIKSMYEELSNDNLFTRWLSTNQKREVQLNSMDKIHFQW